MAIDRKLKVLLVEDSDIMRKMEVKILNELDIVEVSEASDGQQAVEILSGDAQVDLIISDWNMPNMDGYQLLLWVRADRKRGQTPFLMATAQGEMAVVNKAKQAGVSGLVSKPFSPAELGVSIEQALAGPAGQAAEESAPASRQLQKDPDGKTRLQVAHIQITDHLALGMLKHLAAAGRLNPGRFSLETMRMASWNPVAEALANGSIDAAFVLAPIAMDLFAHGVPIKLVLFAHKNGSIFVKNRQGAGGGEADFFRGKSFLIPHRLSIHHMLAHRYLTGLGLKAGVPGDGQQVDVTFEVVPPVQMPEALKNDPRAAGFMVAEPIGTKAISAGVAELGFLSGQAWPGHPCCVVVFRDEVIQQDRAAVAEFVTMLVEAGRFIRRETHLAAEAAIPFLDPEGKLGLSAPILKNVLTEDGGITTDDLFPVVEDLRQMQDYMRNEMGVGLDFDLKNFVDISFAQAAIGDRQAAPAPAAPGKKAAAAKAQDASAKSMLGLEGKYLTFSLGKQEFGVNIMGILEIIGMMPVTGLPRLPEFVKGVINLRGNIVPVIDLRLKMGLPEKEADDRTCIVVVEMHTPGGTVQCGLVVDSVSEVVAFRAADMERPPSFGTGVDTAFIQAMAKKNDQVKILLDLDRVLTNRESASLAQM